MGGYKDRGPAAPPGGGKQHTSTKKSNVAKARVSSPSGLGHAEALALSAQPPEPAEAQQPAPAVAPVRRSPTKAHGSF